MDKPVLIIADASIVLAYILQEEDYQQSLELLFKQAENGYCQLLCPSLIIHEISNRLSRITEFSDTLIQNSLKVLTAIEPRPEVLTKTLELVRAVPSAVWYDAVYHATALVYDGTLLTADKRYYYAAKSYGNIQFIGDYR